MISFDTNVLVYATAFDIRHQGDAGHIARAMRAASSVKPHVLCHMRMAALVRVCGGVSRNKKRFSHQQGVVRQRPAFGHRLARVETARLEKFATNMPDLVIMTRSAKSKLAKQPKPRRQVRGSRQPGHWLLKDANAPQ